MSVQILPARRRCAHPIRPGRYPVVLTAQPVAPARRYDPAAVFGVHRPPAARARAPGRANVPAALASFDNTDDTIVCDQPWWLART